MFFYRAFLLLCCLWSIVGSQGMQQQQQQQNNNSNNKNNITILHEVHENVNVTNPSKTHSISLNKHEILPLKPVKKKTTYDDKTKLSSYRDFKLHPVTFDFNLGDLEDIPHKFPVEDEDISDEVEHFQHEDDDGQVQIELEPGVPSESTSKTTTTTTKINNETIEIRQSDHNLPVAITVSPHIFKVLRKKPFKKSRELLKHNDELRTSHNDLNGLLDIESSALNSTEEFMHANAFQMTTKLFDHFDWEIAFIRRKVSTACGLELQAYLTALHENFEWAQKAYDASGHYRGQMLFGNDKWLGMKTFCHELNRQLKPEERKHFEFEFYTALIDLKLWLPHKMALKLQLGECLPRTCSVVDVHAILSLDPHLQVLSALSASHNNKYNESIATQINISKVRRVPGLFSLWRELKFQIFISIILLVTGTVVVATWYQAKLTSGQLFEPIPAISAQVDANAANNGPKNFELFQMDDRNNYRISNINNNNNNNSNNNNNNNNNSTVRDVEANMHGGENEEMQVTVTINEQNKVIPAGEVDIPSGNNNNNTLNNNHSTHSEFHGDNGASQLHRSFKLDTSQNSYAVKQQLGLHEQLLLCFAFQTNSGSILDIDEKKESNTSCVHGMRVLSVLWTIMVHTYLQIFNIGENRYQRVIVERSVWYQAVGNATFSVDTFFFISGFLVTLLFLKQEKSPGHNSAEFMRRGLKQTFIIVFYRYVRLTPAYLFVIFFNDFSLRQMADSSVFLPLVSPTSCSQYWWRNIFYINNFYPLNEICMIWSWYMANDMQFYIMASVILMLSVRYFRVSVIILISFLVSSWAISGFISILYQYTHKVALPFESFDFLYDKPWQRVGTYITGMITGYVVYKFKTPPKIYVRVNWVLWILSLLLLWLIIFGVWNGELSIVATAFYVGIGHTAFGLGLVWIVLSCVWGYAPTVNRILSYRGLWPLSRLTYCTYLIHPLIMLIISFHMRGTVHLNNAFVMIMFLGNAVISFFAAFFISVMFEAPIIRILKICFKK